jgi:hypothetical protein
MSVRLLITGKMGSGKSFAARYLEDKHEAKRWSRTELMKRLAHAIADHTLPPDPILEAIFPDHLLRLEVEEELFHYAATYMPETGKPRRLYQDITEICQEHDPLCFERELMQRIESVPGQEFCLIDDVRKTSAFKYFVERGFRTLRINADEKTRRERMLVRDGYLPSEETFQHSSEVDLDLVQHDFYIENNSEENKIFFHQLDEVVSALKRG